MPEMTPFAKIMVVIAGYVVALLVASGAVVLNIAGTSGSDAQASSGMMAFGDTFLFVAVFGCLALMPTATALYFLPSKTRVWTVLSGLGIVLATCAGILMLRNLRAR